MRLAAGISPPRLSFRVRHLAIRVSRCAVSPSTVPFEYRLTNSRGNAWLVGGLETAYELILGDEALAADTGASALMPTCSSSATGAAVDCHRACAGVCSTGPGSGVGAGGMNNRGRGTRGGGGDEQ